MKKKIIFTYSGRGRWSEKQNGRNIFFLYVRSFFFFLEEGVVWADERAPRLIDTDMSRKKERNRNGWPHVWNISVGVYELFDPSPQKKKKKSRNTTSSKE